MQKELVITAEALGKTARKLTDLFVHDTRARDELSKLDLGTANPEVMDYIFTTILSREPFFFTMLGQFADSVDPEMETFNSVESLANLYGILKRVCGDRFESMIHTLVFLIREELRGKLAQTPKS